MTTVNDYYIMPGLEKTDENTQTFEATGTTKSWELYANALTHTIVVVVPVLNDTGVTVTLTIVNSDSNEIYSSSALTQGATGTTHIISTEKPLVGLHTVTLTLSGDAGTGGGDVKTTFYLQR